MDATASTIWQIPAYLPYLQPTLTNAAVAAAESQIGYKLPPEYLDLLRTQNGGYIRFSLPDKVHDTIAGIGGWLGCSLARPRDVGLGPGSRKRAPQPPDI